MKRSEVWVVFAIYVFLLGYFTFGTFERWEANHILKAIGLKTETAIQYEYTDKVLTHITRKGLRYDDIPNYGGFFAYLLGGAILCYVLEKQKAKNQHRKVHTKNVLTNITESMIMKEEKLTLHEAIIMILEENNRIMSTKELAEQVNAKKLYIKKDGTPVTAFQIHGRTKNYPNLFLRDGSSVGLVRWQ